METVAFTLQDIADLEAEGTPLLKCATGSKYKIQITRAEQYSFEVLIVDEFGESVTQPVELAVTHLGETLNLTTDSSGKLILNVNTTDGTALVRFTESSVNGLYAMMKSQWQQCPRFSSGDRERLVQSETVSTTTLRPSLIETEFKIEVNKPHRISIQPHVVMARMRGLNFDTNKCFMLPAAIPSMQTLCDIYNDNQETELLLVGHTDTTGDGAYNDTLSLERAEAIRAYLTDDVESWYTWYEASSEKKRWGKTEDQQMLEAVFEHYSLNDSGDKLTSFQKWHNEKLAEEGENAEKLDQDGIIGPQTRRALIKRYMGVDNTSLPQNIMITVHGCGENFPLDATEHEIDSSAPDSKEDLGDRRVELFFFDKETGILPQPPGKNSESGSMEYPEWRARAQKMDVGIEGQDTLYLWLLDSNKKPMPTGTPWKMTMGEIERRGTLQQDGLVILTGVPINDHEKVTVQWGTASQWEFAQSDNATVVPASFTETVSETKDSTYPLIDDSEWTTKHSWEPAGADDHYLRSSLFRGDDRLEKAYDGDKNYYLKKPDGYRIGSQGEHVGKVQKMLLREDKYSLPVYGADEDYGSETKTAVEVLQYENNSKDPDNIGINKDGIVGPVTLGILDCTMAGEEIVAAMDLVYSSSGIQFLSKIFEANDNYWEPVKMIENATGEEIYHPKGIQLKQGASPWKAVYSLFKGPTRLDCYGCIKAALMKGVLEALGKNAFDTYFAWKSEGDPGLMICIDWSTSSDYTMKHPSLISNDRIDPLLDTLKNAALETINPGDWLYYANDERYQYKHPAGSWSGENCIYMGDNEGKSEKVFSGLGGGMNRVNESFLFDGMKSHYDKYPSAADKSSPEYLPQLENTTTYRKKPGVNFGVVEFRWEMVFRVSTLKLLRIRDNPSRTPYKLP